MYVNRIDAKGQLPVIQKRTTTAGGEHPFVFSLEDSVQISPEVDDDRRRNSSAENPPQGEQPTDENTDENTDKNTDEKTDEKADEGTIEKTIEKTSASKERLVNPEVLVSETHKHVDIKV